MKKILNAIGLSLLLSVLSVSFTEAQTHKKWSHRKKDAVIGTAGGAAAGALISHDKSKGAIIGGVAGGAAGYLHGRHKDKQAGTLKK